MNYYIITFDRKPGGSYKFFHEQFVSSPLITGWFHYIKSSYIIKSESSAHDISALFTEAAKSNQIPTTHLVMEVNLSNRQGMLPKDAWEWIKKQKPS